MRETLVSHVAPLDAMLSNRGGDIMANGGFFKGEKKKQKRDKERKGSSPITGSAPVFTLPQVITKKRNEQ